MPMERRLLKLAVSLICSVSLVAASSAAAAASQSNDRIVGGLPVPISQVPWQVAIALSPDVLAGSPAQRQICGGSLVAPTLVITAAHCVYDRGFTPASDYTVISGRTDLDNTSEGAESAVADYVHFNYRPQTNAWDVVMFQLATPAVGNPIQIAGPDEASIWKPGRSLLASGWGAISENGPAAASLQATDLTAYGTTCFGLRVDDPATSFCAGSALGDRDTCYGDSGGPIAAPMIEGGYRLIGDTSYGFGKCGSLDPGAYGKLASEPMRSALADAAMSLAGANIVGSGGHAPTTLSETQARENAWIWLDKDCAKYRPCRFFEASECRASGANWLCPVTEQARDNRGRFTCSRTVKVSASTGKIARKGIGRWKCR
jgi:hypothetical protein